MRLPLLSFLFVLLIWPSACDRPTTKDQPVVTPPAEQNSVQAEKPRPKPTDPVDRVQDPGQRMVLIVHEAMKRADRNPKHCGAAWEDMEAYLNSRQDDLHQAVVAIIRQVRENPSQGSDQMKKVMNLAKELFGSENPFGGFEKRCPKEKKQLQAWLNKVTQKAVQEGTQAAKENLNQLSDPNPSTEHSVKKSP